jgi:hypothetical protein
MNYDQDRDVRQRAVEAQPSAAARLLEITARETDQWRSDARAEATAIVATARDGAHALLQATRENAQTVIEAARLEAARTVEEGRPTAEEVRTRTENERQ